MTDYNLVKQLFKIRTTSIEMISDRGYTVPDHIKNLH